VTPEARAIGNVLLNIHDNTCRGHGFTTIDLTDAIVDSRTIRYRSAYDRAGVPFSRDCGAPLAEIAEWCVENGYPPLHALVVNETGKPGFNYDGSPGGGRLDKWDDEVRACIVFDGYPDMIPG
jgi:hypothetical protein